MKLIKTIAIIAVLALAFSTLFLTTCFSDWQSDAVGYISINLGTSGTSARSIANLITNNDNITRYDIKLTSPGNGQIELSSSNINTTEPIAVPSGEWTIEVWAYGNLSIIDEVIRRGGTNPADPGMNATGEILANWNNAEYLRGYGNKTVTVMPRGRGHITVDMSTVIEVDGIEQFIAALEASDKERIILLKGHIDIEAPIIYLNTGNGQLENYYPIINNKGQVTLIADNPVIITGFNIVDLVYNNNTYEYEEVPRVRDRSLIDFSHPNITFVD